MTFTCEDSKKFARSHRVRGPNLNSLEAHVLAAPDSIFLDYRLRPSVPRSFRLRLVTTVWTFAGRTRGRTSGLPETVKSAELTPASRRKALSSSSSLSLYEVPGLRYYGYSTTFSRTLHYLHARETSGLSPTGRFVSLRAAYRHLI